ncbi:MAG: TetR/AcrR family transcriptional regulator [Phycisphaerales bacterium]|nr:MAG: TetR/AcrR family transcriptional regulator [Phycisphaerales bacterium]
MATQTRELIINTAHDLFYKDGFRGVGLDQILRIVGVTKTTFYNHFECKDALVVEVLNCHDRWWRDYFSDLLRKHGGDAPRDRLLAIFDALEEVLTSSDYNGCIFINVAVEFPSPNDPAHQAAALHKKAMEHVIRDLATYAGAADPAALAQELCMLMEGAYVTAHVTRDHSTCAVGRRMAHMVIDRHIPTPGTAPGATAGSAHGGPH